MKMRLMGFPFAVAWRAVKQLSAGCSMRELGCGFLGLDRYAAGSDRSKTPPQPLPTRGRG
ncbi:hypothetical protein GFM02_35050 [Rhizobium leguminosarum bv. viciae]|nr:hypothetical protein [Rhizobium leguminosarum bv. viciae]